MTDKRILFFLEMIQLFKNKDIPIEVFTVEDKEFLLGNGYVRLESDGYVLTNFGTETLAKNVPAAEVIVRYPMTKTGRVGSYNKVLTSMSDEAANALCCSMITTNFFSRINTSNTRVFIQQLLNSNNHHKWGFDLISKVNDITNKSMDYFKKNKRVQRIS